MFSLFNTENLYIGTDMNRFNKIKDILDANRIKYKYKTKNNLGEWSSSRNGRHGDAECIGIEGNFMYEYKISIIKSNYEKAKKLINEFLIMENKSCN